MLASGSCRTPAFLQPILNVPLCGDQWRRIRHFRDRDIYIKWFTPASAAAPTRAACPSLSTLWILSSADLLITDVAEEITVENPFKACFIEALSLRSPATKLTPSCLSASTRSPGVAVREMAVTLAPKAANWRQIYIPRYPVAPTTRTDV